MNRNTGPCPSEPGLDISEFTIASEHDAYPIRIRSYRPERAGNARLPLLVYFHGGGWVTGSLETDDFSCRSLARTLDLVVLNVQYRLAPEYPFPVGFEDSFDVVKWAATPSAQKQLNVDLSKGFLVGGTSVGCNFAASIAHHAQEAKLQHPITGLLLLVGTVLDELATPEEYKDRILSVDEIPDCPCLRKDELELFAKMYGAPPEDKRRSPLLFDSRAGIAQKAYVAVCGWDPRRDEMMLYEELLKKDGIQTQLKVYAGLPHGFWTVCRDLPTAEMFDKDLVHAVRWLLD
jgi:acetyl esterase/lipase